MPGFSTIGFQYPNKAPSSRVWTLKSTREITCAPSVTGTVFSFDLRCGVPTFAGNTGTSSFGLVADPTGAAEPFEEASSAVFTPFSRYTHGVVLSAILKVRAIPLFGPGSRVTQTAETYTEIDGLQEQTAYDPEADIYITLSQAPHAHGANEADVQSNASSGALKELYNTSRRSTRQSFGAEATGCAFSAKYDPHRTYQFKDILDHLSDFRFATGLAPGGNPVSPTNESYWTISGVPKSLVVGGQGTGLVTGHVLPHRLSVEITHQVLFYNDVPGTTDNIPTNPFSSGGPALPSFLSSVAQASHEFMANAQERAAKRLRDD